MFHQVTPARAENEQGAFLQGMERDWSLFYDGVRYFQIAKEGARSPTSGFYVAVDSIALCDEHGRGLINQAGLSVDDCLRVKSLVEEAYAALGTRVVFSVNLKCNGQIIPMTISNG